MKLSKTNLSLVNQLQSDADYHLNIAARKAINDPSLPEHFAKSYDYYLGLAQGKYAAIGALLQANKAYQGFRTIPLDIAPQFEIEQYFV